MNCKIYKDGTLINTIVASESFAIAYCEKHGYTYEAIPEPTPEPKNEPTTDDVLNALLGVTGNE